MALVALWGVVGILTGLALLRNAPASSGDLLAMILGSMTFLGLATYAAFRWMILDAEHGFGAEWGRRETGVHLERDQLRLQLRSETMRREQAEKELANARLQTKRLREVFQQLNHPAAFLDPAGGVLDMNQSATTLLGLGGHGVTGSSLRDLIRPASPSVDLSESIQRAALGEVVQFQEEILGADQQHHVLMLTLKPVTGERGRVEILIMEGHDSSPFSPPRNPARERAWDFPPYMPSSNNIREGFGCGANRGSVLNSSSISRESIMPNKCSSIFPPIRTRPPCPRVRKPSCWSRTRKGSAA